MASQIQVQAQTQKQEFLIGPAGKVSSPDELPEHVKNIVFQIFTWGSCREGNLYIMYPTKRNLSKFTIAKGKNEVMIDSIAKIRYINQDSSRNKHREVEFVEINQPIIVHYDVSWSCNSHEDFVFLVTSEGFKKLDVQVEVVERENCKFRETWKRLYVVYNNDKIVIRETKIHEELIREKLIVIVKVLGNRVVVHGDTYFIKDDLKKHGLRWDAESKVWYTETMHRDGVAEIIKGLGVQVVVV
jgi:translation elongation factor P/translation initiation factor 5A